MPLLTARLKWTESCKFLYPKFCHAMFYSWASTLVEFIIPALPNLRLPTLGPAISISLARMYKHALFQYNTRQGPLFGNPLPNDYPSILFDDETQTALTTPGMHAKRLAVRLQVVALRRL